MTMNNQNVYIVSSGLSKDILIRARSKSHCKQIYAHKLGYPSYSKMVTSKGNIYIDIECLQNNYT